MTIAQRVLVTGGAGFIGSFLCEALLEAGHDVICLDNFYTGALRNIEHLMNRKQFRLVRHDVTEAFEAELDQIYNLACPASPIQYQRHPVQTGKTAALGAINMLELARRCGARILQASTSEVYGDPAIHPQEESYWGNVNPVGLRACYDEGKRFAESLFFDYHRQYGVRIKVARIFNTYGPRMDRNDGRVVSNFIVQALAGKPITLYGDGLQTRSFCYVSDMVDGLMRLMNSGDELSGPVNLGNPAEFTIAALAEKIIALTASSSPLEWQPLPVDDPCRRRPDISRARAALDWHPVTALEDGLKKTIAYFAGELAPVRQPGTA
jgi:UDP-glucuronate decarboxylase